MLNKTTQWTLCSITSLSIFSCTVAKNEAEESIQQENLNQSIVAHKFDVNQYANHKLVCDPFRDDVGTPTTTYENGIEAELFYRDLNMPRFYKTDDYIQFTKKSDKKVFLTDINVPTRVFSTGFSTPNGDYLKKDNQEKLIEYFALRMNTNIQLTPEDEEGLYEFALLSDDGAKMILKSGDGLSADQLLIDNDGDHPTKLGCSQQTVRFQKNIKLPVEVQYYQGPRYHISNILLWRKVTQAGLDPSCNKLGNHLYFNPDKNSEPQTEYKSLLDRGWKVVRPENFVFKTSSTNYNPCIQVSGPVISNFEVSEVVLQTVQVSWKTDQLATSQVQITNLLTGEITVTQSDQLLRTDHAVVLSDFKSNTPYKLEPVSINQDLGRTTGPALEIYTQ